MNNKDHEPLSLAPGLTRMLDADAAVEEMQTILGRQHQFLRPELRMGIRLLNAVAANVPASAMRDSTAALFWLYLEALDGADLLLRAGAVGPAEILGRTLLEDGLQLVFLLQRNDARLATAYLVDRLRRNLCGFEKLVDGSPQKRELVVEARRSWLGSPVSWKKQPDTSREAANIRDSLSRGHLGDVSAALDALPPNAPWYAIDGGPRDLVQLAREFGMDHWHRMLYAPMSDRVHGRASNTVWHVGENGDTYLKKLRGTADWNVLLVHFHFLNRKVFDLVAQRFAADLTEGLSTWFQAGDGVLRECLERNGLAPATPPGDEPPRPTSSD